MPLVNIAEKEREAKKVKDAKSNILIKEINGVKYFSHKDLPEGTWLETFDEALQAAQDLKTKKEYKAQGLNENGQTKEDAEKTQKIRDLIAKKAKILEEASKVDLEIAAVKNPPVKEEKKKK